MPTWPRSREQIRTWSGSSSPRTSTATVSMHSGKSAGPSMSISSAMVVLPCAGGPARLRLFLFGEVFDRAPELPVAPVEVVAVVAGRAVADVGAGFLGAPVLAEDDQ